MIYRLQISVTVCLITNKQMNEGVLSMLCAQNHEHQRRNDTHYENPLNYTSMLELLLSPSSHSCSDTNRIADFLSHAVLSVKDQFEQFSRN